MATLALVYSAWSTIACGLASLASSATFVAGREAAAVDNAANLYLDALVAGKITVGTTPTVNTQIIVYGFALRDAAYPDQMTGSDAARSLTSVGVGRGFLVPLGPPIDVDSATSNRPYDFGPVSLVSAFSFMPQKWGLFVTHNTVAALHATAGNHEFKYQGVKVASA